MCPNKNKENGKPCCDNCVGTQVNIISGDYNCRTYAESKKKKGN